MEYGIDFKRIFKEKLRKLGFEEDLFNDVIIEFGYPNPQKIAEISPDFKVITVYSTNTEEILESISFFFPHIYLSKKRVPSYEIEKSKLIDGIGNYFILLLLGKKEEVEKFFETSEKYKEWKKGFEIIKEFDEKVKNSNEVSSLNKQRGIPAFLEAVIKIYGSIKNLDESILKIKEFYNKNLCEVFVLAGYAQKVSYDYKEIYKIKEEIERNLKERNREKLMENFGKLKYEIEKTGDKKLLETIQNLIEGLENKEEIEESSENLIENILNVIEERYPRLSKYISC